ncbi:glycosyltransferase family 2 protein [Phenylobacterium sp. J367]|uniref:glycosyltransferase family 2 protein n=1 Tax=Phenylobacterium sp. J367 TaxID=2898435 RepID=UPI0021515A88|nr:glycosyltransferase [Phenylobacterium sp. J367]MCR5880654.1 glycosyltransferase [Phenylobacterium sp. J367]
MGYRLVDLELAAPLPEIVLEPGQTGVGVIARWNGRLAGFAMIPRPDGRAISAAEVAALADERFARAVLAMRAEDELRGLWPAAEADPAPSLSVAICTKDRARRLARLLGSVVPLDRAGFRSVEIVVVDNAPSDDATRRAVEGFPGVRYVLEPRAGLDFARNAALNAATGDYLAYLDDDVVVDRGYLAALSTAILARPDAGGFTGLVLPFRLDTEAQVRFESRGGFGRGFLRTEFRKDRFGNRLHPVGAGILGAGCNMCFDRRLLLELGGFDEALDTGAPLPGGGDLDIFYRVLRSGRPMLYEPGYAVFHEHRETLEQLQRQYWTWGLGFMAFLTKCRRTDPALAQRQSAIVWWWALDRLAAVARAGLRGKRTELGFAWAELKGGVQGMFGEYDRSCARSQAIREATA